MTPPTRHSIGSGSTTTQRNPRRQSDGIDGFRPDIDGLRAVAIVVIVAYHAGAPGFDGGAVGVDVFFVISGYLISRNLLSEASRTNRVSLAQFWARRVRRLVPALGAVVLASLALSIVVQSPLEWGDTADDARVAALYVSNVVFAVDAADYFASDQTASVFLHTWSLGVEEQFYLVWPWIVVAGALLTRRSRRSPRTVLTLAFSVIAVASFALCVALTRQGSTWAFYGLPSRAWEFAVGGLLALAPAAALGPRVSRVLAGTGLLAIGVATITFDESIVYPGAWPLVPVIGTALLIHVGGALTATANPVVMALQHPALQWIGRLSYSWYLWHWPVILLASERFDSTALWITASAAAVSLVIAIASYRWIENPIRNSPALRASLSATYAFGAASTVLLVAAAAVVAVRSDTQLASDAASRGLPDVPLDEVRATGTEVECDSRPRSPSGVEYCVVGADDADVTVMLVGDSHAQHWAPAFAQAGEDIGVRVVIRQRSACPAHPVRTVGIREQVEDPGCRRFRRTTDRLIDELEPAAVIASSSYGYGPLVRRGDAPDTATAWERTYLDFASSIRSRGIRFASVVDTPRMEEDAVDCLSRSSPADCATPRESALGYGAPYADAEARVRARLGDVPTLDVNDRLCDATLCPVVLRGTFVYRDQGHIFEDFMVTLTPDVTRFLEDVLEG